jgi:hypothetical protein
MLFLYRDFNIECFVEQIGTNFVGRATISRVLSNGERGSAHDTGFSPAFATETKALGHARNFAEMWCDTTLLNGGT